MSTSPATISSTPTRTKDVFERLAECDFLLNAKELGQILGISPKTIYSYVSRNLIPYYKIESNVRFRAGDVMEWLRRRAGCRVS
ncbi:MAG: helix-turn-helix domain-containing protein [Bryobacteraceae bacterium]|jgi:excisionase family DNA binding protein